MRTSDCLPHQVRAVPSVRAALARRVQQCVLSARGAAPAAIAQDGAALLSWLLRRVPAHQLSAVAVEHLAALLDEATSTRELLALVRERSAASCWAAAVLRAAPTMARPVAWAAPSTAPRRLGLRCSTWAWAIKGERRDHPSPRPT
jgi:hypothetical protein